MDDILAKAGSQAVTFAIRSGISFASGYAIKTVVKFIEKLPQQDKKRIEKLYTEIQTKISIVSNSMDLIRLAAARGNTILTPTLALVDSIQQEIEKLDVSVNAVLQGLSAANEGQSVESVLASMRALIATIERALPFLQLSISTSGIQASSSLPAQVSPGRLLQASNVIATAELAAKGSGGGAAGASTETASTASAGTPVGPPFDCILYSIFYNPSRLKYVDETSTSALSWKEDFARATVQIVQSGAYAYHLEIREDFNDERYHEDTDKPRKHVVAVSDIARLFFSASGQLLKLEGNSSPVLILKLTTNGEDSWVAFGETGRRFDEDDEDEENEEGNDSDDEYEDASAEPPVAKENKLSLLEYIIRLLSLQVNHRQSILAATDERLALYLRDENYTLNTAYLRAHQDAKNTDALDLESNVKRLESLKLASK